MIRVGLTGDATMSKDYRREKEDFDNNDWLVGKEFSNKDNQVNDVKKRKRASKYMSRERSKHAEFH
jgi:phosphopantothenoylcysteine synthetase/decarboxylase